MNSGFITPVPLFGNWLQVGDDLNHRNLTDLAKNYGEIFMLRRGHCNLVVISSPDLAKELLHTQGVEFGSWTRNVVFHIFSGKGQDMVFTVYGDHWRQGWEAEITAVVEEVSAIPEAETSGIGH